MGADGRKKASREMLGELAGKARSAGRVAAKAAQDGAGRASDLAQQARRKRMLAKYKPVFPKDFFSKDFDLPAMVVVEDEAARREVEICKGAIGWLSRNGGMDVFHLYEEAVSASGLALYPATVCDAVYYFDKVGGRFVDLCQYFEVIQKDKMTELRNIAYSLGAKECRLEAYEEEKSLRANKGKSSVKAKAGPVSSVLEGSVSASAEAGYSEGRSRRSSVVFAQKFEGSDNPVKPELHWYKNDRELISLIEMRCSGRNPMKEYSVKLDSMASSSMSISRAAKIDIAVKKIGAVSNFSFEGEAQSELRKRLVFEIVF